MQRHAFFLFLGVVGIVLMLSLSTPSDVSLSFLLVPFLLIGFVLYHFFSLLFARVLSWHKKRLNAALVSGFLLMLIVLSSLDQLSLLDILVATIFLVIALAYIHYMHFFE